jgi:alginate O-acetyltransferase complex protein AlgJ
LLRYRRRIWKLRRSCLIALLLGSLALPLAGMYWNRADQNKYDLRKLAERPIFHFTTRCLRDFPQQFESYFNDHFGYRRWLITWSNRLKVGVLKVSSSPNVLIGRDGWSYFVEPTLALSKAGPFTTEQLEIIQETLQLRQQWLAQRGCRYLLFIAPDKQTIYPEHLPPRTIPMPKVSRLDQLVSHLRSHSTVPVLDIREELREAKKREQLYFKLDTHWNDRGAFIAYQALGRQLTQWFSNIEPLPRSAFQETTSVRPCDLALMLGKDTTPAEESLDLTPILPRRAHRVQPPPCLEHGCYLHFPPFATEQDDSRLPRAVIFHDSFFLLLSPFIAEHFGRVAFYWDDLFHPEVIERENPAVVIQELVERKLEFLKPESFKEEVQALKQALTF